MWRNTVVTCGAGNEKGSLNLMLLDIGVGFGNGEGVFAVLEGCRQWYLLVAWRTMHNVQW